METYRSDWFSVDGESRRLYVSGAEGRWWSGTEYARGGCHDMREPAPTLAAAIEAHAEALSPDDDAAFLEAVAQLRARGRCPTASEP